MECELGDVLGRIREGHVGMWTMHVLCCNVEYLCYFALPSFLYIVCLFLLSRYQLDCVIRFRRQVSRSSLFEIESSFRFGVAMLRCCDAMVTACRQEKQEPKRGGSIGHNSEDTDGRHSITFLDLCPEMSDTDMYVLVRYRICPKNVMCT